MWIAAKNAFLSIVRYEPGDEDDRNDHFLVRARLALDLERVFGAGIHSVETSSADYRFRAILSRKAVEDAIVEQLQHIDYPNFKCAVHVQRATQDPMRDIRYAAYTGVWEAMAGAQSAAHGRPYSSNAYDHEPELDWGAAEAMRDQRLEELHDVGVDDWVCPDCGEGPGYCQCFGTG